MGSRQKNNQHIQVYVRSRPINAVERATSLSIVDVVAECKEVRIREKYGGREYTKIFKFDKVFSPNCTQVDVFNTVMTPVIEEVLMGYNCTVFVYGQTGSGKTYTMEGEHTTAIPWEKNPKTGIIPRALSQLFDDLQKQEIEYTLHISFLELYNEELFDLLSPENSASKLRLFEDVTRKGSVVIQGLEEIAVHSKEEVYLILERGSARRKTAATLLNATSSRSHTVFSITMHMKETTSNGDELLKTGKLNLVDLAGSENIGRSGAIEGRAREAGSINQSLLTLGRVITSLVEKAPHIPYRESKLTRLLQDSLGGKTKTTIIATISPALCNLEETLSTLEYAHRAKKITNCPEVNQKTTKQALLKEYTQEIERLRRDLAAAREKNGVFVDADNYQNMQQELLCRSDAIKELNSTIEALKVEMEKVNNLFTKAEEELIIKSVELETCSKELEVKTEKLTEKAKELNQTKEILNKTEIERAEQAYLAEERAKTEKKLASQAKKLIEVADESTSDVYALHAKLDRKSTIEVANEQHNSEFKQRFDQSMVKLKNHLSEMCQKHTENTERLHSSIGKTMETYEENSRILSAMMSEFISKHSIATEHATTQWSEQIKVEDEWRVDLINSVLKHKEAAVNSCNTYLTEKFSPLLDEIVSTHHLMDDQICKMRELIHLQHKQQEENIRFYVEQFGEEIEEFKKLFISFNNDIQNQLVECSEYANYIANNQAIIVKQYEEKKTELENLTSSLNEMIETFKTEMSNNIPKLLQCHSQLVTDSGSHKSTIEGYLEQMSCKNQTFKTAIIDETNNSMVNSEDNMSKIRDSNQEILDKNNFLKTNIMAFGDCTEQVWQEYVDFLQNNLDEHAKTERQNLVKNLKSIEEMDNLTKHSLRHHEDILYNQRKDFELQALSQKSENSMLEDIMKLQIASLLENVEECDEGINSYITNWRTDIPTGETPQRKDYSFPKTVPESSPAERILQRFRTTISDQVICRKSTPLRIKNENDDEEMPRKEICSKKTYARDSNSSQIQKIPKRIFQGEKSEDKENVSSCATTAH